MARAGQRMAVEGPNPEIVAEINRVGLIARVLIVILFVLVFMMVTKLGT